MAKTDLTFEELNAALGGEAITQTGSDILISVQAVTGDSYDAIMSPGVVEFMYKLRSACGTAQNDANAELPDGETGLDSFPGFSFSPPADGYVTVSQSQTVRIPLDSATVIGTSV